MKYVKVNSDYFLHFMLEGPLYKEYPSIGEADIHSPLVSEGTDLLIALDDHRNIVFICDIEDMWQNWCERQVYVDADWNYRLVEHPHFCKVLERWIRFCVHKGVSGAHPLSLPRRMQQPAASKRTEPLARVYRVLSTGSARLPCKLRSYP